MKIVRVLVYEGDEESILRGLVCRAVAGERVLGNGVKCSEVIYAEPDFNVASDGFVALADDDSVSGQLHPATMEFRAKVAALPVPDWVKRNREADTLYAAGKTPAFVKSSNRE